ncbi:hypothetical protein JQ633_23010 [Bradyrhizobium tropiciagri]|uniref:hypothetical protein n=1 Tax=Bradyrhizobium tropiciagri TaxID=312253 RepID=UPI001BA843FE|nr:hypothetical protein [Bradyrhizobium tropiciagri]MBR0873245.1 hypothetical protein [Bradyrhizobium tropiciagri]
MQIKETIGVSIPGSVEVPPLEDVVVLVDSAGGSTVCIESERGAGTRVRLLLPRVHAAGRPGTIVGTEIAYTPSSTGGIFHLVSTATAMPASWPARTSGDRFGE